jgi:hypothetical protein
MKKVSCFVVFAILMGISLSNIALSGEKNVTDQEQEIMMIGLINNSNQIIDNKGQIFDIDDNKEGRELAIHVGMQVYVKGTIKESLGQKRIKVSIFEIIKR